MNLVDTSGWIEYFFGGGNASYFAKPIEQTQTLLVPVICIYEVFKRLIGQRGENTALIHIGDMHHGQIAELTASIALQAAKISTDLNIAMADSIILATARAYNAIFWTQDSDFEGMSGVEYIPKSP